MDDVRWRCSCDNHIDVIQFIRQTLGNYFHKHFFFFCLGLGRSKQILSKALPIMNSHILSFTFNPLGWKIISQKSYQLNFGQANGSLTNFQTLKRSIYMPKLISPNLTNLKVKSSLQLTWSSCIFKFRRIK